jgi:hypothetical protein
MSRPLHTNRRRRSSYPLDHAQRVALRTWVVLPLTLLLGCGQHALPATVEGTLRVNGKPLDNCLITFLPEPAQEVTGPHSTGLADQRGYYCLRFNDQRQGASVGWHRVIVQDLSVSTGVRRRDHGTVLEETEETASPPPVRRSRVPVTYSSPEDTPLRKKVKTGHQVIDLDIR